MKERRRDRRGRWVRRGGGFADLGAEQAQDRYNVSSGPGRVSRRRCRRRRRPVTAYHRREADTVYVLAKLLITRLGAAHQRRAGPPKCMTAGKCVRANARR